MGLTSGDVGKVPHVDVAVIVVVGVVSLALVLGAVWGAFLPFPDVVRGNLLGFAGGALVTSVAFELVEPSIETSSLLLVGTLLLLGSAAFTAIDYWIDEAWDSEGGGGILAAVTLDGVPENLALGVALIGTGFSEVAALSAAIFLSNFPEAAGGGADLREAGWNRGRIVGLWALTAAILALAAIGGYVLLDGASDSVLAAIRSFAAGAVLASLATEVYPQAFDDSAHGAGIATAAGFVVTFALTTAGA